MSEKEKRFKPIEDSSMFAFDDGSGAFIDFISDRDYFAICEELGVGDCDLNKVAERYGYTGIYAAIHVKGQYENETGFLCFK